MILVKKGRDLVSGASKFADKIGISFKKIGTFLVISIQVKNWPKL
jgi:hypothetical protein